MEQLMYSNLNRDADCREQIIFGDEKYDSKNYYPGGIRYFRQMTYDTLKTLVDEHFTEFTASHNNAPSIGKFLEYAKKHPGTTFGGFAIKPERSDYRISIDSVQQSFAGDVLAMKDFANNFHVADDFRLDEGSGYAWWD